MTLRSHLVEHGLACFTGLGGQPHEHEDAIREIPETCRTQDWKLALWDVSQGLQVSGGDEPAHAGGGDPPAAIRAVIGVADSRRAARVANRHGVSARHLVSLFVSHSNRPPNWMRFEGIPIPWRFAPNGLRTEAKLPIDNNWIQIGLSEL